MKPPSWSTRPSTWSPRMVTMTWQVSDNPTLALKVLLEEETRMKSCSTITWEGLPGWTTQFELEYNKAKGLLILRMWPEPIAN